MPRNAILVKWQNTKGKWGRMPLSTAPYRFWRLSIALGVRLVVTRHKQDTLHWSIPSEWIEVAFAPFVGAMD